MTVFARVVFPLPLDQVFLYEVPDVCRAAARPGARVLAPLGSRREKGFIVGLTSEPPAAGIKVKPLVEILDDRPFREERFLEFTRGLAAEFHSSWGEILQASLPPSLTLRTKTAVRLTDAGREALAEAKRLGPREKAVSALLTEAPKGRSPVFLMRKTGGKAITGLLGRMAKKGLVEVAEIPVSVPRRAAAAGAEAPVQLGLAFPEPAAEPGPLRPIAAAVAEGRGGAFYLFAPEETRRAALHDLVRRAIGAGGRVLYLFPEVAPTAELAAGFKKSYGRAAVVFHGRMTEKQREEAWRVLRSGRATLIAGTRSALFAETGLLRLVVADNEQDESYVQAESPSFDARRGAMLRARADGAVAVLASSRPSVEAFAEAGQAGTLIDLGGGPARRDVTIVDHAKDVPLISAELERRLGANIGRGETAILFLNRRGYAAQVACGACGRVPRCPRCDIALVFHKADGRLVCHYCGFSADVHKGCAGCGGEIVVRRGAGTQAVEEELGRLFPGVRTARFDTDTAGDPEARQKLLADVRRGRIALVVATRLLVHQPDAPKAGLVAILRPEAILGFSDYRAGQKTFEAVSAMLDLRRDGGGAEAVIQTAAPVHFSIAAAAAGDYGAFYDQEIAFRRVMGYPPFASLAEVLLQGRDVRTLAARSRELRAAFLKHAPGLEVLGPAFAPVARVKELSRVQFILKSADRAAIDRALDDALPKVHLKRSISFSYSPFRE
jgi:primosomal protein N' (replication factor Y) (superfamily II helicase)